MTQQPYSESYKAIQKAEEAIEVAKYDLEGGFTLAATNRCYYACYYCMVALLIAKNAYAKTHQGTRAKFSELFIMTNIFPEHISQYVKNAFELRQEADYDFDADISVDEVRNILKQTTKFYNITKEYFQRQ